MAEKTQNTVTVAKITAGATIAVAIISLIGNLVLGYWQFRQKPSRANEPLSGSTSLSIEQIPQDIFANIDNNKPDGGEGIFLLSYDATQAPTYGFNYSLPTDKKGYARLAFQFIEGQNLSDYNAVELTLIFNQPNDSIDFYIKDISGSEGKVHIFAGDINEMVVRYYFVNFNKVNFNAVKEVGLFSATEFATGDHRVRVKNIRFVK